MHQITGLNKFDNSLIIQKETMAVVMEMSSSASDGNLEQGFVEIYDNSTALLQTSDIWEFVCDVNDMQCDHEARLGNAEEIIPDIDQANEDDANKIELLEKEEEEFRDEREHQKKRIQSQQENIAKMQTEQEKNAAKRQETIKNLESKVKESEHELEKIEQKRQYQSTSQQENENKLRRKLQKSSDAITRLQEESKKKAEEHYRKQKILKEELTELKKKLKDLE
ncbi:hypothetical protein EC973_001888 [Apophysomyces ossiformis]|uniref:Uncharacterized protein n=1 Tax=Apophysomyces ossiformis TaxID=679940 RepID=A0A8H7EM22_9FUNG|nr:hypothetical protein EC973_001888 [Apophysomyces ossiformis]